MDVLKKINTNQIVIYGAGNVARLAIIYMRNELPQIFNNIIGCAVSTEKRITGRNLENVPIKPIDEYMSVKDKAFFLIAANPRFYSELEKELQGRNIKNYDYFDCNKYVGALEAQWEASNPERYAFFEKNVNLEIMNDEERNSFLSKQLKSSLDFEVNIADHCNLNCQSCNHFSPLAKETFLNLDIMKSDLQRIYNLYGKSIGNVMLLGGEPLLHPQINDVLKIARGSLPEVSVALVTNGILLPKMDKEFWNLMRDLQISLNVTVYPIHFNYEKYEAKAQEYGIKNNFDHASLKGRKEVVKTTYVMPIRDSATFSPYQMYAKCAHANFCVALREGRLYNCSFAANVHHYNAYFQKHIPANEDVSIDIYNSKRADIDEFLKMPNQMCAHCDICGYKYDIPWAVSIKEAHEWMGE